MRIRASLALPALLALALGACGGDGGSVGGEMAMDTSTTNVPAGVEQQGTTGPAPDSLPGQLPPPP
ncbi:MAG TPA: hypothetical protein VK399_19965 [Longimicrobiaceae bacterium]|nr:hypothetical protein [Longimicrobiaceae bacterium]